MKLYLIPKGENGLPLHPTANVEECMKSYDKIVGELYTEEEVLEQLNLLYSMKNALVDTFTDEKDFITIKWFEQFKKK
jgi:hypothetical protein